MKTKNQTATETKPEPKQWPVVSVGGFTGRWSNERLPHIGDRVKITFNGFGDGTILNMFIEYGYLGVIVKCDKRPEWHVKQHGNRHPHPMVFGAEIKFL